jgi:hypothetical protein
MSKEAVDRAKRAKTKAKYRNYLEELKAAGLILSINDLNNFTAWELTGTAALVGSSWTENRITRLIIRDEEGNEATLTNRTAPAYPNIHPQLGAEIPMHKLSTIDLEFSTAAEDKKQEISLWFRLESNPNSYVEFKTDCILPADQTSATLMSFASQIVTNELIDHLNENALYYSQAIWMGADPGTLFMQLSDCSFRGKRLIEYIDPSPLSVAGNSLVFRWKDEADNEWQEWKQDNVDSSKVAVDLVALPTGGVFAEAVLGRFNSAEKLDVTRFWNWQDSPIPIQASEIAAIQAGQQQISVAPQTGSLEPPIINIQTPQSLPDPTGMSSIISALTSANMFRDMSGVAQTAALAQAALQSASQSATAAASQAGANMATAGQFQVEMTKALLPLVGAALGIPVPPSTGTSNITNAGAAINHGAKLDAKSAGSNEGSSVAGRGASGASSTPGGVGGGPSGSNPNPQSAVFASNRGGFEADAFNRTIGSSTGSFSSSNVLAAGSSGGSGSNLAQTALEKGQGAALALVEAMSKWNSAPDANLSDAMKSSLLKFAEEEIKKEGSEVLKLIPLGKALQVAVEFSLAFADGVGSELTRINDRLNSEYAQAIRDINLDDDGLSQEEIERMRILSSYQLTAANRLKPILESGLRRMAGQAILSGVAAGKKVFDDNFTRLVISLAKNDELFSLISSSVEEARKEARGLTTENRRSVKEGILAFVFRAFIKQLPKSEFKTALSDLIKPVKGNQPIVLELLAGAVQTMLDMETDSLKNQFGKAFPQVRQTVLDSAKEFHLQFKSDGSLQLIPVSTAIVEIDQNKLTLPESVITELEAAVAAERPESLEESSARDAFFAVKQIQNDRLRVRAAQLMNRVNHGSSLNQMDDANRDTTANAMQLVENAWQSLGKIISATRPELSIDQDAFIRNKLGVENTLTFYRLDKMQVGSRDLNSLEQTIRTDVFLQNEGIEL